MKSEKKFDAVKMMREIRDKLSREFMNMNYKEQKRYIKGKVKSKIKATQKSDLHVA
ncbi:MAG: hypothetical protein ACE5HW_04255 [Candidatus Methanofastidiosia archaeon]